MDLDSLALLHGTDKASDRHNYTGVYELLFESIRNDEVVLLELGVDRGQSMRLWADYFRSGIIVGIDNFAGGDPRDNLAHLRNVHIFQCDQADPALQLLVQPYCPLNIIIDDCSHITEKTIASFKMLWPLLDSGGVYIIEDIGAQPDQDDLLQKALNEYGHEMLWMTWYSSCHPDAPHFQMAVLRKAGNAH